MKRILTAVISTLIFISCQTITGSGNIITQTKKVSEFEGVKTSGSIDIEVSNNKTESVKIEADDNVLPYVIITVEDGILNIHYKRGISFINDHVKVYVSAPVLKKLIVSGSGNIISAGTLKDAAKIEMKVSGSGNINATVDAPAILANIGGSGTVMFKGKTKEFTCNISGSGDIKANNLLSENTGVTVSGSGTAHVFASVQLNAKVSGSGEIFYSGNPTSPQTHISGSGTIEAEK